MPFSNRSETWFSAVLWLEPHKRVKGRDNCRCFPACDAKDDYTMQHGGLYQRLCMGC